jgi:hypothetical protein
VIPVRDGSWGVVDFRAHPGALRQDSGSEGVTLAEHGGALLSQGADHWMHVLATAVHELLDGARGSEPAARDNRLL